MLGNAGSFFKNPVVSSALAMELKHHYPAMPCFTAGNEQNKLAAGWLIDQAGLKGFSLGAAGVHRDQALVLVNLGNATGHPSRIMDGSFANQVLAQMHLFKEKFADLPADKKAESVYVKVLPKKLDEEVAAAMVAGFNGVLTKLTQVQADYIGVAVDGPFKPESYKY